MAGLIDQIEEVAGSGTWVSSVARIIALVGTPVLSFTPNYSGEALADDYNLTFIDVNAVAHTAKVIVTPTAADNPYKNLVGIAINIDGATVYSNVIPGFDIVFSGSGSFLGSWEVELRAGDFDDTYNAYGSGAGTPGPARKHRVQNTDAGAAADCKATLKTGAQLYLKTGIIFNHIKPFADGATEKTANDDDVDPVPGSEQVRPYRITVENVTGSGASKVMDYKVDGALVTVRNLSTGATGDSEGLNVVDSYKIESGNLQSLEFKLSQSATNGSIANVLIFPARYTEIAPDIEGVAGSFDTADVILTQTGEAAGIIQASGVAYYWVRTVVPEGANSESNPYPTNVFVTGKQTGAAGWAA